MNRPKKRLRQGLATPEPLQSLLKAAPPSASEAYRRNQIVSGLSDAVGCRTGR